MDSAANAAGADNGPFLAILVSSKGDGCEIGASLLHQRASRWDDDNIQSQLALAPGQLSSGATSGAASGDQTRSSEACRREEWDLDVYQFTDSITLGNLESLLVRTAPQRVYYSKSSPKSILKQLEQLFTTLAIKFSCLISILGIQ